jgi:hypothetical protein
MQYLMPFMSPGKQVASLRPKSASTIANGHPKPCIKKRPQSAYPAIILDNGRSICFESQDGRKSKCVVINTPDCGAEEEEELVDCVEETQKEVTVKIELQNTKDDDDDDTPCTAKDAPGAKFSGGEMDKVDFFVAEVDPSETEKNASEEPK